MLFIDLPDELLIYILNFLNFKTLKICMELKNKKIYMLCKYIKNIDISLKKNEDNLSEYLLHFDILKVLKINYKYYICSNNLINIILKKKWSLKKLILYSINDISCDKYLDLFKSQKSIENIKIYNSNNILIKHVNNLNVNILSITLRNNNLELKDINVFNKFKKLNYLDLSNSLSLLEDDNFFSKLSIKNLKTFKFSYTNIYIGEVFFTFLNYHVLIKVLFLDGIKKGDKIFENINKSCPNLENLSFSRSVIENKNLFNLKNEWKYLRIINLSCSELNNIGLKFIINVSPLLETININDTFVTNNGIVFLSNKIKKIKNLYVNGTDISNVSIKNIRNNCILIKRLEIRNTKITNFKIINDMKKNNISIFYTKK